MALWFGGLALLLVVRARARRARVAEPGRAAVLAAGAAAASRVLGVTGVYLAWRQSGELAALPATEFGRLLLIKSAIVLVIVGLAVVLAAGGRADGGDLARRLRRTVLAEAVLGVVVLGVTATLVNAAPARVATPSRSTSPSPGPRAASVQVHVEPAKQGQNVADVYLVQRDGGAARPAGGHGAADAAERRGPRAAAGRPRPPPSRATTLPPR